MFTSFMGLGSMAISQTEFNKARHGDAYYIAASPPFRSRACWLALIVFGDLGADISDNTSWGCNIRMRADGYKAAY